MLAQEPPFLLESARWVFPPPSEKLRLSASMLPSSQRLSIAVTLLYNPAWSLDPMGMLEVLDQVRALLQREDQLSYCLRQMPFGLDDDGQAGPRTFFHP